MTRFIAIFLLICVNGSAQQKPDVEQTLRGFFEALSTRNETAIRNASATDLLIAEDGVVWNLHSLITNMRKPVPTDFNRQNGLKFHTIRVENDIAWTTYENEARITASGNEYYVKWLETAVLEFHDRRWKIRTLHSATIEKHKNNPKKISPMGLPCRVLCGAQSVYDLGKRFVNIEVAFFTKFNFQA